LWARQELAVPKVSIVIPVYNRVPLLIECLKSVRAQSFEDYEVIVVDDGSTEDVKQAVSPFRVRYVRQEQQGPPGAYNTGIKAAKGEYVAFLDSDDLWLEGSLEQRVDLLDQYPEAGFCYSQAYRLNEADQSMTLVHPPRGPATIRDGEAEIRSYLANGNHIFCSTVLARRKCLEEVGGFDAGFRSGSEDLDVWIRLLKKYSAVSTPQPLAIYRVHAQSFSSDRELDEWEQSNAKVIESILNDSVMGHRLADMRPGAYFHLYSELAARAKGRGDLRTARRYLSKAWRVHPAGKLFSWLLLSVKVHLPRPMLTAGSTAKQWLLRRL